MYGVIDGAYICNLQRANQLNERISSRNVPSRSLEPVYSIRPVSTKYATLPIVDRRPESNVSLNNYPKYNLEEIFNPGNAQAPWNGFASQINVESSLRNQFFALQKANQAYYIPSSNSSLYNTNLSINNISETHKELFNEEDFNYFNPNPNINIIGNSIFNNCTRCQVKNLTC